MGKSCTSRSKDVISKSTALKEIWSIDKVRLCLISYVGDAISGYTNLCLNMDGPPFPGIDCTAVSSFIDLDKYADDNEVEEIVLKFIVDYYSPFSLQFLLEGLVKKLSHGGQLIVEGNDFYTLCKLIARGDILLEDGNKLLRLSDELQKMTVYNHDTNEIKRLLTSLGLKINKVFIRGYNYAVRGIRS